MEKLGKCYYFLLLNAFLFIADKYIFLRHVRRQKYSARCGDSERLERQRTVFPKSNLPRGGKRDGQCQSIRR